MLMQKDLIRTISNPVLLNSKAQDRGNKDAKDGGQYTIPSRPKCFGCEGFGYMKQECPT